MKPKKNSLKNNIFNNNNNNNNFNNPIKKTNTFNKKNFTVKSSIKNKNKLLSTFFDSKNNNNNNNKFNSSLTLNEKFNLIPQMQKSLERTEKIEDDIHFIAYKNKNKKGNIAHFKTTDFDRILRRLSVKIEHNNLQLEKIEACNKKNEEENSLLKKTVEKNNIQKNFFGDFENTLKKEISDIRKKIQELSNQKRNYELKSLQFNEEIKYLNLDVEKWKKKVEKEKKEVEKGKKALTKLKDIIYDMTKGSKLNTDFVKKVAELIKEKEK